MKLEGEWAAGIINQKFPRWWDWGRPKRMGKHGYMEKGWEMFPHRIRGSYFLSAYLQWSWADFLQSVLSLRIWRNILAWFFNLVLNLLEDMALYNTILTIVHSEIFICLIRFLPSAMRRHRKYFAIYTLKENFNINPFEVSSHGINWKITMDLLSKPEKLRCEKNFPEWQLGSDLLLNPTLLTLSEWCWYIDSVHG